jgi:Mce-associated membrane protein
MIDSKEKDDEMTEVAVAVEQPRAGRQLAVALSVVVLLLLSLGLGTLAMDRGNKLDSAGQLDDSRSAALEAARDFAVLVTTYDPKTLDASFDAVLEHSTGEFHDQYATASDSLRDAIVEVDGSAKGEVIAAGISKASDDRVEVVIFIDQTVSNKLLDKPRVDRSRMSVVMERRAGSWLVSEMQLL